MFGGNRTIFSGLEGYLRVQNSGVPPFFVLWRHFRYSDVTSGVFMFSPGCQSMSVPSFIAIGQFPCLWWLKLTLLPVLWCHFRCSDVTSGIFIFFPRCHSTSLPCFVAIRQFSWPRGLFESPKQWGCHHSRSCDVTSGLVTSVPIPLSHVRDVHVGSCQVWWEPDKRCGRQPWTHRHTDRHADRQTDSRGLLYIEDSFYAKDNIITRPDQESKEINSVRLFSKTEATNKKIWNLIWVCLVCF